MVGYIRQACGPVAAAMDADVILAAYRTSRASKDSIRFPDDLVRVYSEIAPGLGLPPRRGDRPGVCRVDRGVAGIPPTRLRLCSV